MVGWAGKWEGGSRWWGGQVEPAQCPIRNAYWHATGWAQNRLVCSRPGCSEANQECIKGEGRGIGRILLAHSPDVKLPSPPPSIYNTSLKLY